MRFRSIEDHRKLFLVRVMCSMLRVSASGYYVRRTSWFDAWHDRPYSARAQGEQDVGGGQPPRSSRQPAPLRQPARPCGPRQAGRVQPGGPAHAQARHPGAPATAVSQDHGQQPCLSDCPEPAGPAVRLRGRAEPGLGKARASPGLADMTCIATCEGWLHHRGPEHRGPRPRLGMPSCQRLEDGPHQPVQGRGAGNGAVRHRQHDRGLTGFRRLSARCRRMPRRSTTARSGPTRMGRRQAAP